MVRQGGINFARVLGKFVLDPWKRLRPIPSKASAIGPSWRPFCPWAQVRGIVRLASTRSPDPPGRDPLRFLGRLQGPLCARPSAGPAVDRLLPGRYRPLGRGGDETLFRPLKNSAGQVNTDRPLTRVKFRRDLRDVFRIVPESPTANPKLVRSLQEGAVYSILGSRKAGSFYP